MEQPQLGKKISELRKAKGYTQEELVERCNISVRTIQRIETGEVTPRVYTIKTILAALDTDLQDISGQEKSTIDSFISWFKSVMLIDVDQQRSSDFLIKQLNIAWIFGCLNLLLSFFESATEYARYQENQLLISTTLYIVLKLLLLVSFVFFQRGFVLLGTIFNNYLLKVMSVIAICGIALLTFYDIVSLFYDDAERELVLGGSALCFGVIGIVYGISLRRLRKMLGRVSSWAGVFEMLAGCFFLTIVLFFIAYILLIPAAIFEIIVLYKAIEIIKEKRAELI